MGNQGGGDKEMAKAAPKTKKAAAKTAAAKSKKPVKTKGVRGAPKAAAAKPATGKAGAAAKPAAKPAKAKASKAKKAKAGRGNQLYCEVCGLVVSIDEACGCAGVCDIICCEQQMQPKK